ncbi:MAG TPA: hypothetical protein VE974_27010 [Thermoanaerobaculia bacterium]|nr:hypothetical protein [Thermoanaerobaculia bacterium]
MNVEHERSHAVRAMLKDEKLLRPEIAAQLEQPWRTNGVIVQAIFFVLTCIGLGAFYGFLSLLRVGYPGVITAVVAIVLAEYLIGAWRWYRTGVEAALWIGGLLAAISELPRSGTPESILVIAAAFAIAGARARQPLFGAAAVLCIVYYCEDRFDLGVVAALLLSALALLALLRTWKRPSNEWLLIAIALTLPFAGISHADREWRTTTITLYTIYAALAFALAVTRRHHAFFLAGMIGAGIAATELAQLLDLAPEAPLFIAGALLLGIAFAVSRALRDRTRGFVLTPAKLTPFDDELELAATLAMKPETPVEAAPKTGGGSFGGAGASGDY